MLIHSHYFLPIKPNMIELMRSPLRAVVSTTHLLFLAFCRSATNELIGVSVCFTSGRNSIAKRRDVSMNMASDLFTSILLYTVITWGKWFFVAYSNPNLRTHLTWSELMKLRSPGTKSLCHYILWLFGIRMSSVFLFVNMYVVLIAGTVNGKRCRHAPILALSIS